jgi:Mg2+ and Co2+ transporter CorA
MTALASIAGNRQGSREHELSVLEAKRAKSLTSVGLVFIPLAYTAFMFGVDGGFRPEAKHFWIYWLVSIPVVVLVIVGYYLLE